MESENLKVGISSKSVLTCSMLTIILELCHELMSVSESHQLKIPEISMLFEVRDKIIQIAFSEAINNVSVEVGFSLAKDIRKLNSCLRCFGVYKTKKRKSWSLDNKKLESVLRVIQFDEEQSKESKKNLESYFKEFVS